MFIIHTPYPPRQIKKMIQHLLGIGAERISKINYSKSYTKQEKKVSLQKESVLLVYHSNKKKDILAAAVTKQYPECDARFIDEQIV